MPTTRTITNAQNRLACLRSAKRAIAAVDIELGYHDDDHDALRDVGGPHPVDILADARAAITEREDALAAWLSVHDRDAA